MSDLLENATEGSRAAAGPPRRRSVVLELLALAALAAAFLLAFQSRAGYIDVALATIAVIAIGLQRRRSLRLWATQPRDPSSARQRLWSATRAAALFTLVASAALLAVGIAAVFPGGGWGAVAQRVGNWHLVAAILLYAPWALLQQFVFQFYLLGRLLYLLPLPTAVGLTAIAFSMVHFPRLPVMAVTLIAGVVWALLYRRYRSLLPLAISHAVLGAVLHYWAFGRDLLAEWLPLL